MADIGKWKLLSLAVLALILFALPQVVKSSFALDIFMRIYFIDPATAFSFNISIEAALVSIVGGIGTLWGPVIGTVVLETTSTLLQSWLGSSTGGIQLTVYSLILMAIILWRPTGLMGLFNDAWQRHRDRQPARMRTSP